MKKLWFALVAAHLLLVASACGGTSPVAPAPTPQPIPLPPALIQNVQDTVTGIPQADGTFAIAPTAANNGTGCAGSISGSTDFNNAAGPVKTVQWALPAGTVIKPNERFQYTLCCLTRDQAFSAGIIYFTRFQYTTVACQ